MKSGTDDSWKPGFHRVRVALQNMFGVTFILLGVSFFAAADEDPVEILARLRDQGLTHARRIPNHT